MAKGNRLTIYPSVFADDDIELTIESNDRCRHCPYGHYKVKMTTGSRSNIIKKPTFLKGKRKHDSVQPTDVLFWTGGKKSLLALLHLKSLQNSNFITLLTTVDSADGSLPYQGVSTDEVMDHSIFFGLDHLIVPVVKNCTNEEYLKQIQEGLGVLQNLYDSNARLVFGDLHPGDLYEWKMRSFPQETYFPLLNVPFKSLIDTLFSQPNIKMKITACALQSSQRNPPLSVKVGDDYDLSVALAEEAQLSSTSSEVAIGDLFHTVVRM